MNTHTCPEVTLSPHPIAQLWHSIAARWSAHLTQARQARDFNFADELGVDTLRDIGAPEQWVSRAAAQREREQQRLGALRQWRDG